MRLTAPSKTFLIGEYAVLAGYSALVATAPPYFSIEVLESSRAELVNIHLDSPAGKFWLEHGLPNKRVEFFDPHEGIGGFGASSAQFLLLYQSIHQIEEWDKKSLSDLLISYKKYAGEKPSGADVLSQAVGGFVVVNPQKTEVESFEWPFENIDWLLEHTGHKCSTHVHLQDLAPTNFSELGALSERAIHAYKQVNASEFIRTINQYYHQLCHLNLVDAHTQRSVEEAQQKTGFLAAKGCGAMGADVVLRLIDNRHQEFVS